MVTRARFRIVACAALALSLFLGGCVFERPASPTTPTGVSPTSDTQVVLAAVLGFPGVLSSTVTFSPERFGYPASFSGRITVTSPTDPVAVLDQVLFILLRDSQASTFAVTVVCDGFLYDGQRLGLRRTINREELVQRFGNPVSGDVFPTPAPPRPSVAALPSESTFDSK